jgi:hypothetical protein
MNLEQFAKKAGVTLTECDSSWGGTIGYKDADYPNSMVCGFRTSAAAYKHWLEGKFGKKATKVVLGLLSKTTPARAAHRRIAGVSERKRPAAGATLPLPPAGPSGKGGWCEMCGVTHEGPHPAYGVESAGAVALKVEDAGNGWKRQTAVVDGVAEVPAVRKRLCRDCADFAQDGICPNDGKPCSPNGVTACRWPDCDCHSPQGPGECRRRAIGAAASHASEPSDEQFLACAVEAGVLVNMGGGIYGPLPSGKARMLRFARLVRALGVQEVPHD